MCYPLALKTVIYSAKKKNWFVLSFLLFFNYLWGKWLLYWRQLSNNATYSSYFVSLFSSHVGVYLSMSEYLSFSFVEILELFVVTKIKYRLIWTRIAWDSRLLWNNNNNSVLVPKIWGLLWTLNKLVRVGYGIQDFCG